MTGVQRTIRGHAMINPLQTVHISQWSCGEHNPEDGPDSSFALTLKYLWGVIQEDASFWRSLGLLRQGLVNLASETAGISVVLITAAFEALIPTLGKQNITNQLTHMLGILTGDDTISKWFDDLYDLRSKIIHGDNPLDAKDKKKRQKYEHILYTASRHAETAKEVIQLFALQRRLLCTDTLATETSDIFEARNHFSGGAARCLSHNNEWGCTKIKSCKKDGTKNPLDEIAGFLFVPEDNSAHPERLIRRGFDLAELFANQLTDRSSYDNSANRFPLPDTLNASQVAVRTELKPKQLEREYESLKPRLTTAMNILLLGEDSLTYWYKAEQIYDLGPSLLDTIHQQLAVLEEAS